MLKEFNHDSMSQGYKFGDPTDALIRRYVGLTGNLALKEIEET
jgi:hypothetical protein